MNHSHRIVAPAARVAALSALLLCTAPAQITAHVLVERFDLVSSMRFGGETGARYGAGVAVGDGRAAIAGLDGVVPLRPRIYSSGWWQLPLVPNCSYRVACDGSDLLVGDEFYDSGRGRVHFLTTAFLSSTLNFTVANPSPSAYWSHFGGSVAMAGGIAAIGKPDGESVYLSTTAGGLFKTLSSGSSGADKFGTDVAMWARSDGRQFRLAVGAPYNDAGGTDAGAVYLYQRDDDLGGSWVADGELHGTVAYGVFGCDVDLDGDDLVVGSNGKAYVYRRGSSGWSRLATLSDSGGAATGFGNAVAVDDRWFAVGAPSDGSGKVKLYQAPPVGPWLVVGSNQTLTSPDATASGNDNFGGAIAIDGGVLLIGAPGYDGSVANSNCGAAYAYELTRS
ncbi:MAG: hypothetical protein U1E73_11590 [Planctomycetota bacterium]